VNKIINTAIGRASPASIRAVSDGILHSGLGDEEGLIGMDGKDNGFLFCGKEIGENIPHSYHQKHGYE
jgi:hypothetical protein